jgi:alpha-amylase/alpha-mannosidase (GH57 family)
VDRYVCIHGHFYQPPRENPWLGSIEVQDGAAPYHDWNERITAECYAPNARSRILNGQGRIHHIVNNYARMSFNFGPTLLSWLEQKASDVYHAILAADRESRRRFGGHGNALAQPYNHTIMPLTSPQDRRTQVEWGIRDFKHRFGRQPEGMWLPETAVDAPSLETLAEAGIRFTVLAPHQAKRVRSLQNGYWQDVSGGSIDPRHPYLASLPSGRKLAIFFYDGPASRAVAFERLLTRGEDFVDRIRGLYSPATPGPQLAHIATDGETYGHHHRFGDMALAYALEQFDLAPDVHLTNYGEFLKQHPPQWEVEVQPNTSWSCSHGVERWRRDCGCATGGHPGWNQSWRKPLREGLDWLHSRLGPLYEHEAGLLLKDPWAARDDYIDVILDRSPQRIARFLSRHAIRKLEADETVRALRLLEMQTHAMLMYTSCGWFFDDLGGIETIQILQYAARAIQLAEAVSGDSLEAGFLHMIARAKSNRPEYGGGEDIYRKLVKPARVHLREVVAHYAVSSLFEPYEATTPVHCYTVKREDFHLHEAGRTKLAVGRVRVTSRVTLESERMSFGVLHFGEQTITGGVREYTSPREHARMGQDLKEAFDRSDLADVIHILEEEFPGRPFSLRSLFRDEQRKVLRQILEPSLAEAEAMYRSFYEEHIPIIRFLNSVSYPMPNRFRAAAEFSLNLELRRIFAQDEVNVPRVPLILEEAGLAGIDLDSAGLGQALKLTLERLAQQCRANPDDVLALHRMRDAVRLVRQLPFGVDQWSAENAFYDLLRASYPRQRELAFRGDPLARRWLELFVPLGQDLRMSLPDEG